MSQKKPEQTEANQEDPSEIEIVTVGVKNFSTEVIAFKEQNINLIPPSAPPQFFPPSVFPQQQDLPQLSHLKNEVQIKEGQKSIDLEEEGLQDQDDENLDSQQDRSSNSQKSQKKAKSICESQDEKKDGLPTSRKCFNKLCSSKKIYKKIRSRVEDNKYRFFCKNCYQNYYNNLYCQFCQQIYFYYQNEDFDKWVGCDKCERWNHIECQEKFRNKGINELKHKDAFYHCLMCQQKAKPAIQKNKKQEKEQAEEKGALKQKNQINREKRVLIFNKKIESLPTLQYFLQTHSFRLWISESQIKQDLQHLRSIRFRNNHQDPAKNKPKKSKND